MSVQIHELRRETPQHAQTTKELHYSEKAGVEIIEYLMMIIRGQITIRTEYSVQQSSVIVIQSSNADDSYMLKGKRDIYLQANLQANPSFNGKTKSSICLWKERRRPRA